MLEGRPDLAGYNEGCRTLENFVLLRQAVAARRAGTRFIAEVKDSTKDTLLLPFEVGVANSFVIEVGDKYMRFYKDNTRLESAGVPVEIKSPYNENNIRVLHYTQSVDVLFLFHSLFRQRRLSHVNDTTWRLHDIINKPPPSFEADFDISDSIPGIISDGAGQAGSSGQTSGNPGGESGTNGGSGGGPGGDGASGTGDSGTGGDAGDGGGL